MNVDKVLKILEDRKDERGIKIWERSGSIGMKTFGIGVTKLKQVAKEIKKNHELAIELWKQPILDARLLSCMIDDPKQVTVEQLEEQVGSMNFWMLSHTYCSYLLPKTSFLKSKADEWHKDKDDVKRRCSYLMLYQLAKNNKDLDDSYFENYIVKIEKNIQKEENYVKDAMNTALWRIGQRNKNLHSKSLKAAKKIGDVMVDYGDNSCQATDVVKSLTSERILKKIK